ncbi:MAG: hypothetical protein JXA10_09430 [Anaerolineae bacterium]|nr:hypothetical protein [Anaerolineae bacterium]
MKSQFRQWVLGPSLSTVHHDRAITDAEMMNWGWFPIISVIGALGLLGVSLAFVGARRETAHHELLFLLSLFVFYFVPAFRILSPYPARRERLALLLMIGIGMYLIKVMHSPLYFTFFDELLQYRTSQDILVTDHLFSENSLLPVGPLYPGLHSVATAIVSLSGLDLFTAGVLTILMARITFVLTIYLFFEQVAGASRVSSIATLLYMTNPHFLFFDAQFSYESLAIVTMGLVLMGLQYRLSSDTERAVGLSVVVILALLATIITHHITSYYLLGMVVLWGGLRFILLRADSGGNYMVTFSVLAVVVTFSWMIYVANATINYLVPVLSGAILDLGKVILREEAGRSLGSNESGVTIPWIKLIVMYLATLFIFLSLCLGALFIWRDHRAQKPYLVLTVIGLLFPVTQLLRFTSVGPELAARVTAFMYIGIAFVMAIVVVNLFPTRVNSYFRQFVGAAIIVFLFWDGVILSFPQYAQLPGPYLASADTRSVEATGIETALWTRDHIGAKGHFIADRINGALLNAFGGQLIVSDAYYDINTFSIFLSGSLDPGNYEALCVGQIQYVLMDYRFTEYPPMGGFYYDEAEQGLYDDTMYISSIQKFDALDRFNRIFDNGIIAIYQVDLSYCG